MSEFNPADTFRQEAQELLEQLEQTLLDLEHTPNDTDLIDTAFRALHTIKGSGAMCGFDAVAGFTHHVETAFDLVRKGKVPPSPGLIAVALSAKDHMRLLIEQPETTDTTEGDAILRDLAAIVGNTPAPPGVPAAPATPAEPKTVTWHINFRLATNAMANGTNPLFLLDELRTLGQATIVAHTDAIPGLEDLVPTDCLIGWSVVLTSTHPRDTLESVFMFVIDDMQLSIEAEDCSIEPAAAAVVAAPVNQAQPPARPAKEAAKTTDRIRVPAERLDHLMEQVGELVIVQSRLTQVAATSNDMEVKAIAEDIERLTMSLRDTTMGVRTLPIAALFGRFRRLVHDLSHELGKEIDLITVGEHTEIDSTVIERLADPLTHLIRNSLDHGLETPEVRLAAGKPRRGKLTLAARHAGAEVHVSITDDGRGLDRARIRARAEDNGLLAPGVVLSDNELFQVLFLPGFSTAAQVTSLSGRGVGMDVVKRTIEDLRGKIDIASTSGAGTQMSLRLPLTLAIIDGLMVRVGTGRYVLPLSSVEECVELSAEDDARSHGRNFLNIRGDLVPYLRLRELFHAQVPADRYQKVVVVSAGDSGVGLVVDQVIGNHQTVIKSLSQLHADVRIFSGATILGNGAVALILDIAHLVELGVARDAELQAAD